VLFVTINNVRIFLTPQTQESNLKAIATMLINNQILLQSIRIFQDENRADGSQALQVSYPVQRMNNGNLRHCMYPSNKEVRMKFDSAILEAYNRVASGEADDNTIVFSEDTERIPYEITRASIYPSVKDDQVRAKVGLELDGEIWLRGIYMLVRENGSLFLNMPRRQIGGEKKEFISYFHPIDQDARNALTETVMPFYEKAIQSDDKQA